MLSMPLKVTPIVTSALETVPKGLGKKTRGSKNQKEETRPSRH